MYQPRLKEIDVPIVLINNQNQQKSHRIHSVAIDDIQGGQLATQHLIAQGHRVIGYVGGPPDHAASRDRLTGYQRALAEANIPFDPALVLSGSGRADGGEAVTQLLTRAPAPTAFFCYNDMTAIGALRALKQCGRRVPADISLVGYDDIPFASYVDPPLTTIHQPKDEMGRLATQMLLDLLSGKKVANVMSPGRLVVRESTRAL